MRVAIYAALVALCDSLVLDSFGSPPCCPRVCSCQRDNPWVHLAAGICLSCHLAPGRFLLVIRMLL